MATKEIETRGKKKPILLKGTGRSKCLEMKLGSLGIELWDFPDEDAQPYARLLFQVDRNENQTGEDDQTQLSADLDVMQAGAISVAIEQWMLSFESETRDESVPSIRMQIGSLTITLFPETNEQRARAELIVCADGGAQGQAVLTRLETSLLGTLLESLVDDEEADCREFVG